MWPSCIQLPCKIWGTLCSNTSLVCGDIRLFWQRYRALFADMRYRLFLWKHRAFFTEIQGSFCEIQGFLAAFTWLMAVLALLYWESLISYPQNKGSFDRDTGLFLRIWDIGLISLHQVPHILHCSWFRESPIFFGLFFFFFCFFFFFFWTLAESTAMQDMWYLL